MYMGVFNFGVINVPLAHFQSAIQYVHSAFVSDLFPSIRSVRSRIHS